MGLLIAAWWWWRPAPQQRAARLLDQAVAARSAGRFAEAERAAAEAYRLDPARDDARLVAATSASSLGQYERSLEHADGVSPDNPSLFGGAQLLLAEIAHEHLLRLSDAERHYRAVLELDPDNVEANQGLARLLGQTGRRDEAISPVLRLIRAGAASDLLMLLARDDGVIDSRDMLRRAAQSCPDDPLPRVGLAWHASDRGQVRQALDHLQNAVRLDPDLMVVHAAIGRQWAALGEYESLARWSRRVPPGAERFADTWIARGRLREHVGETVGAIRCYAEAARRRPESKLANGRLAQLLATAGHPELAAAFGDYLRRLQSLSELQDRVFFATEPSGLATLLDLVSHYVAVGRFWEAFAWSQLAMEIDPDAPQVRSTVSALHRRLRDAPLHMVDLSVAPVGRLDLKRFPRSQLRVSETVDEAPENPLPMKHYRMRDVTAEVGLDFQYFNGSPTQPPRRMYEFSGGGVAALDYDLDGWPDCFFSQGTQWPAETDSGDHHDALYRNLHGESFRRVGAALRETTLGFGQGVTVGDYNADGFPDLYVANAGDTNRLYRNNGDGTFSDVTEESGLSGRQWTTSCVMADLNGDGLSDIYDVNYVQGKDVFERVCVDDQGHPAICMPFDFDAQRDTLWLGGAQGRFRDATETLLASSPLGKGLGVAALDVQGRGQLSLMVANDTTPNLLFVPEQAQGHSSDAPVRRLKDIAIPAGVAFNEDGKAEGCMGIAVGDVDQNGFADLMVTNFLFESNSLYMARGPSLFSDRTRATGLHEPSLNMLGFGTQFLDLDLDGQLELFVANGHIDDLSRNGRPYTMRPQLFAMRQGRFEPIPGEAAGEYFRNRWLGRAAARLDWNRDGREDLLVGHLYDSSRLLTNATSDAGNFLAVRLVGVDSNRDCIGAQVTVFADGHKRTRQLTSGDGYQARNQAHLIFGLGKADSVRRVEVRWPSGEVESFASPPINQEILLVEGQDAASRDDAR